MTEYIVSSDELTLIADKIREKSGSDNMLEFPNGFASEIEGIEIKADVPHYTGSYTATPDVKPVTLHTKDMLMDDNITVFKVPLWKVSNTSGGETIYIGGEEIYGEF